MLSSIRAIPIVATSTRPSVADPALFLITYVAKLITIDDCDDDRRRVRRAYILLAVQYSARINPLAQR